MAAAYAALVSVMHIIDQIQLHPHPPISLEKPQVESLTEKITFLQEFLEDYSHGGYSKKADALESRITKAAYAAEDLIESHIVDQILAGSTSHSEEIRPGEEIGSTSKSHGVGYFNCYRDPRKTASHGEKISSVDFCRGLWKVIEDMDSIKKKVMKIKQKKRIQHQRHRNSTPAISLRSSTIGQNVSVVGFDGVLLEIMDKLRGGQLDRQIIPIVGMSGIGKTTLSRNIYQHQGVVQHFDILAWVTISQEYQMKKILLELLQEDRETFNKMDENQLGVALHKKLSSRRYLIIMDDIWDIKVWDHLKFFFPDNKNGSRILLTTRLSNLASQVADSFALKMTFLDEDSSWKLFSKTVFGEEVCPLELKEIGERIVKDCKGLPLSIVVIGGLLAKSKHTREYWEYVGKNLNSVVNLEDHESSLKILHMSYNHLPIYLKPCFLYMGVFWEDQAIRVSMLIRLWVAEGLIKPVSGKSLEELAEEYLKELIDRNLILVHTLGSIGSVKHCNIHDLLRDLCLREAQKERFYNVVSQNSPRIPQGINNQRRVVIRRSTSKKKILDALQSMSLARSLISELGGAPLKNCRLLRILKMWEKDVHGWYIYHLENLSQFVNSRYIAASGYAYSQIPSSIYLLWNLHTLIVDNVWAVLDAPVEIWNMPQLRHVEITGLRLPDPPSSNSQDDTVLGNLQTLTSVRGFKFGEEVTKRIPNIKKLKIDNCESPGNCYLNNLDRLQKLESLGCSLFPYETDSPQNLTFPHSLNKLTLDAGHLHWEDMLEKIGSLPFLEKLELRMGSFEGRQWETVEGQFRSLKFLQIGGCHDLEYWTTDSSHFPRLQRLVLHGLQDLKEIPPEIGEIPTLQSIELKWCCDSAVISAKMILEEQVELYGEADLQVGVTLDYRNKELESLASPNFHIKRQ